MLLQSYLPPGYFFLTTLSSLITVSSQHYCSYSVFFKFLFHLNTMSSPDYCFLRTLMILCTVYHHNTLPLRFSSLMTLFALHTPHCFLSPLLCPQYYSPTQQYYIHPWPVLSINHHSLACYTTAALLTFLTCLKYDPGYQDRSAAS